MSEETNEEQVVAPAPTKGVGQIIRIGVGGAAVLLAVLAGLLTFRFVLAPMLEPPEMAAMEEVEDPIPLAPVMLMFDTSFVNVIREGDFPASTLVFGVTLECMNQETANLIEYHKPRFIDMIIKLHDSRTRVELDDSLTLKNSIQRQAVQKCNDLLRRLQASPNPDIKVTAVFHHSFTVQDQL
ncbi:MAG: hypothetical protein IIB38_12160 [Candidatus Hydrogenedentes bacterium]|nr:hypothetical protein [Candidatus Hydrogenedentota bacterium]